jgi:ribosome-associated translation inhibitor RaiA
MQLTPIVTFRGIARTKALKAEILARVRKLETYYSRIIGCRVLVELVERHHEAGNRYHVRIELTVPGEEIVVSNEGGLHATARDIGTERLTKATESDPERKHATVAIREAFDIARRRLQDYARRQRGAVKTPARRSRGPVTQQFPIDEEPQASTVTMPHPRRVH